MAEAGVMYVARIGTESCTLSHIGTELCTLSHIGTEVNSRWRDADTFASWVSNGLQEKGEEGLNSYLLHSLRVASVAHCSWTILAIAFHHIHNIASGQLHISGYS